MIDFYLGEEKYVTAQIVPKKSSDVVVVTEATYELINQYKKIVDSGTCDIDGKVLTILLAPVDVGSYTLKISARVGAERIIEKSVVNVRE